MLCKDDPKNDFIVRFLTVVGTKRKPNDCVVYGAILHVLGAEQCHMRQKVECGAAGIPMSGV